MPINWYDDIPDFSNDSPTQVEEEPQKRPVGFRTTDPLPPPSSIGNEIYKGVSAGGRGLMATGAGILGLTGDALGNDELKKFGLDTYKEQEEISAERNAPSVASYKDIHNFSDFGKYAAYGLSKGLTETAPLIAMGGIGGQVASKLADGAIKEAIDFGVAQGLTQEVAEKAVATAVMHGGKDIAEGVFKEGLASSFAEGSAAKAFGATAGEAGAEEAAQVFGEEAADMFGQKAIKAASDRATAGFVGSQAGNAAAITTQSIADTYGQTGDAKTALEYGGASGALNSLAFGIVAAPAFRKMIGLESSAAKGAFFKHLAAKTATDTALMSGVAYPSTYLSQEAQAQVDPNFDVNSEEASQQRKEAMFGGAVMGAGFGLGFGGIEALGRNNAPLTAQALRQISITKPGDGGVPDGGKVVPDATQETLQLGWSPPGDKESSKWSRPTYITENGVSIRAQKDLSMNRWVIPDPDSFPDSLKVTGLRTGVNGNVIIDPSEGPYAATLSFNLDMALDKLNNPPLAPEPLDLKFPNAPKIQPNDRLSEDTDTTGWAPPTINGGELANKSAEESSADLLEAQQMEELRRQSPEEYEMLKRRLANQEKNSLVSKGLHASDMLPDESGQGQFAFDFSNQKSALEKGATAPEETQDTSVANSITAGDQVSFIHPDIGRVQATIEEGPRANTDGDKISDTIRLSYIDPKTEDRESVSVPRHSWSRIEKAQRTPDINGIISDKVGSNPTPEDLQQLGFTDVLLGPDPKKPAVVGNNVVWDGLGENPGIGDLENKRGNSPTESKLIPGLKSAYGSGDYSEVTSAGFLPIRTTIGAVRTETTGEQQTQISPVRTYGIFVGGLAEGKAEIEKAKETTIRQWNMGLPVLAKRGQAIPEGFEAITLKNGLQKITKVTGYMDRTWSRDNTPESFRVDQPLESAGKRSRTNGIFMFDHFYDSNPARIERSERQRETMARRSEGDKIEGALTEKLSPLEEDMLGKALKIANDHINEVGVGEGLEDAKTAVQSKLIRQMVPPSKAEQVKGEAPSRATRPGFVTKKVSPEQAISNRRVESIFLNSVNQLLQLKKEKFAPDLKDRIDRADAKKQKATAGRTAKEKQFDPVRESITGVDASKIAKSAYRSAEGGLTDVEYSNIVQDILATSPEFSDVDVAHLKNVKDYHQKLSNVLSERNVKAIANQELKGASKRSTADVALRGPNATISIDNQRAVGLGEEKASLSRENRNSFKPTLGEMQGTMAHAEDAPDWVPDHLQDSWARREQGRITGEEQDAGDGDSDLGAIEMLHKEIDALSPDEKAKLYKIGMLGQRNDEATKLRRTLELMTSKDPYKLAESRNEELLKRALGMFGEHLESKAGVKVDGVPVKDPLSKTNAATFRRIISRLKDKLNPQEGPTTEQVAIARKPDVTTSYADTLIARSEAKKAAISAERDRLIKAKKERDLARQKEFAQEKANRLPTRPEIRDSLKQTRKEIKANASTPKDQSGRDDGRGNRTTRDGVSNEDASLGGLESVATKDETADQDSGYRGVRGSTGERPGNVQESPGSSTRGGSGVGAPAFETRALGEGARRLIVESAGNLSKEESAKLTPSEVNAAHDALNTTADVKAAHKSEVITGATPRIEDIASKSLKEILQGVADEQRAYLENKIRVDQIRNNHGDLLRAGGFHSPLEFLKRVASGKTGAAQDMVTRAKAMLALQDRFDWNKISTQVGSFRDGENRASWAGYASKEKGGRNIYLNLDANHRRGSIVNTYLHELTHSIASEKLDSFLSGKGMKLTQVEVDAANRLKAMHEESLRRAASKGGMAGAKTATLDKLQAWAKEKVQKGTSKYAMFTNLHEFVQELQDSPEAHKLLSELGYGTANKEEAKFTFSMGNLLKEAFNAITQLITGRKIDANSPLAKAFADSWDFTFNGTIKQSKETPLHGKLADFKARESWIKDQLEQRDLAGTTDDRKALSAEWDKTKGQEAPVVESAKAPLERRQVTPASEVPRLRISDLNITNKPYAPDTAAHLEAKRKQEALRNPSPEQALQNFQDRESWIRDQVAGGAKPDRKALLAGWEAKQEEKKRVAEAEVLATKQAEEAQREASVAKLTKAQAEKEAADNAEKEAYAQRVSDAEKARVKNDTKDRAEAQVKLKNATETLAKMEAKGKLVRTKDGGYVPAEGKAGKNALAPLAKALADIAAAKKILGKDAVAKPVKETEAEVSAKEPVTEVSEPVVQESGESRLETAKNRVKAAEAEIQRLREDGQIKILDSGHDSPQTPEANDAFDEKKQANLELKAAQDEAKKSGKGGKRKAKTNPEPPEDNPPTGGGGGGKRDKSGKGKAEATQETPVASEPTTAPAETSASAEEGSPDALGLADFLFEKFPKAGSQVDIVAEALFETPSKKKFLELAHNEWEWEKDGSAETLYAAKMEYLDSFKKPEETAIENENFDPANPLETGLESTAGGNSIFDRIKESAPAEMLGKAKDALVGETIATFNGGTYKKGGLINSAIRGWDIRQQNNWFASRGRINEQESRAAFFVKKLDAAVKSAYPKGSEVPWEQMNTALGNIRNPLTEENLAEIRDTRAKFGRKAANALEAELRQTNREIFKKDQQAALDALPKEVSGAITQMTDHISALSQTLNKENILTGDLKAIVDANGGIYLNRSYQIFDDPKWQDKVRKIPEIINPVTKLLRDRMIQSETSKVMMESQREGKKISREEAIASAKDRVTDEMVNGSLERLLSISEDGVDGIGAFGKLPGRKDVSLFDNRGQISKEIQDLWGVHTDPKTNYTRTISKMASLIGDHQFLNETRNMGLNEGWLWNPKDENNAGDHAPAGYKKFAAEGNKSLEPLDGLYMKNEMADAMRSMYPKDGDNGTPAWLRYMMKLTGLTMMAKTVLSPATQIRNFMGNLVFLVSTGNFNVATIKKLGGDARDITNPFKSFDTHEKVQGMVEKLTRLGIVNQSVGGRMIRELMQENNAKSHDGSNSLFYKYVVDPTKKVTDFAQKSYEFGDSIYKATIWMAEREKYEKAFPKMTAEELDQRAADIARSVHPTYELSPSFTKELQKFPIIAPFIRFTTEIYRTTHNLTKLAYSEIKEGNATGNTELAKIGWGRVKGMAALAIGPSLAIAAQQAMMGTTSEDEEAVRNFLPDWQKNNQLFIWKNGDGKVSYYDYTYLDAYGTPLREPIKAIFRAVHNSDNAGEAISNAVLDGVRQAISPFSNEQILSGAIMDIARNKSGASGAPVFNPQDSIDRQAEAIGLHVASAFSPGLFDSVSRVTKGFMGSVSDSGKEYNAAKEIAAPFVGRVSELNVSNALQFKASQFLRNERDSAQILNHELLSQGTRTNEAVMSGYARSNESKMELVKDLRKNYQSAIALGLSPERAAATLSGSHIGKDVIGMVTGNYYTKLEPSKQSIKLVNSRGQGYRVNALDEIMKNTPSKVSFK
jgi:hypothetical protein